VKELLKFNKSGTLNLNSKVAGTLSAEFQVELRVQSVVIWLLPEVKKV
jgi:hypothetical protein